MRREGRIDEDTCDLEDRWLLRYSQPVNIEMVGVWDTVGKVGVPFGEIRNISSKAFGFLDTGLRKPIKFCFHAIAIDEHRRAFPPTLWTIRKPHDPNEKMAQMREDLEVRTEVVCRRTRERGGGYPNDVLGLTAPPSLAYEEGISAGFVLPK